VSYKGEIDIHAKITNFITVTVIMSSVLKPNLVQQRTRLGVYNVLAKPTSVYGSEIWTIKIKVGSDWTTEARFIRRTAGCTVLAKKGNEQILEELKVEPIATYRQQYRAQWKTHNERLADTRWPKLITSYKPPEKGSLGRPLKRWSESVTDQ
jgi:hypothetical protein